jgi:hypothetical protein
VPSYPDQVRRQERAEARKRRRRFITPVIVTFRMAELFKVFCYVYGGAPLPDDDDGRDSMKLVFQVLSTTSRADLRMPGRRGFRPTSSPPWSMTSWRTPAGSRPTPSLLAWE